MPAFAMVASDRKQVGVRRIVIALVAAVIGVGALGAAQPYGHPTTNIELRVWQGIEDRTAIAIGARSIDGSWGALGMVPLPLDDGFSPNGDYRYGQTTIEVPLTSAAPVAVEVRVWQAVRDESFIFVSARAAGGSWGLLGTVRLLLDDGLRPDLGYRFGDMRIEVELPEQRVVTLAGRAMDWGSADGAGKDARFGGRSAPWAMGLEVDADGSVIVADYFNSAIRRVARDGTVTTIAGGNGHGLLDGPADVAQFAGPTDVALAPDGTIYVAQRPNNHIRKITPDGMVTTVAGDGSLEANRYPSRVRDGPVDQAVFYRIHGIALAPDGDLYILEDRHIRRLSPSGWVSTFVGGSTVGFRDGRGRSARFYFLKDIAIDASGDLYVIDSNTLVPGAAGRLETIRKIDTNGVVRTLFRGRAPHLGGQLASPEGLTVTSDGTVYISNTGGNQIMRLTRDGELRVVAGAGEDGYLDGPYGAATFSLPGALAFAPDGALIVADQGGSTLRAIVPGPSGFPNDVPAVEIEQLPRVEGVGVTRFAGRHGATSGLRGDGGPATRAYFNGVRGIALDPAGNVIVADDGNHAIRRISANGTITTLAGGSGEGMRDGPGDQAQFARPLRVAVGTDGTVFVAESGNDHLRSIAPDGTVSTVTGEALGNARAIATDPDGSLLIARSGRILRRSPAGSVSTVVGDGSGTIYALAVDNEGSIFFTRSDTRGTAVKWVTATGDVSTVFEDGRGPYRGALSRTVLGIAVAPDGAVYLADQGFGRVVRIDRNGAAAIVADLQDFVGAPTSWPNGIVLTSEGDLLVSDRRQHVIWKITIDEGAGR